MQKIIAITLLVIVALATTQAVVAETVATEDIDSSLIDIKSLLLLGDHAKLSNEEHQNNIKDAKLSTAANQHASRKRTASSHVKDLNNKGASKDITSVLKDLNSITHASDKNNQMELTALKLSLLGLLSEATDAAASKNINTLDPSIAAATEAQDTLMRTLGYDSKSTKNFDIFASSSGAEVASETTEAATSLATTEIYNLDEHVGIEGFTDSLLMK